MPHDPLAVARSYMAARGVPFDESASTLVPDPAKSRETAALYEKMKHSPNNPKVRRAYAALARETKAQFLHAKANGMVFEPWTRGGQPYTDSDHMRADVRENGHLHYFPTDDGFGADGKDFSDHPLYQTDPETGLKYNDMFRAVHDYFAHAVHPHQFGPKGEMRAWHEHAKMFSPLARLAMTAETHGQNSWVNFGPHSHLPVKDRPYADQKATLMPVTQHPVKLARPAEKPGIFGRFKAMFGGTKPPEGRSEYDGIVHTGRKGKTIDPDGYAKVVAERSAIAQALQRLGSQTLRTDPAKHREKVNLYTDAAAWLHEKDFEGLRPILDHYRKAANQLNAPDVVNPQPDKAKLGEFPEPPNPTTHYTVPNIGPAGKDLTDAAVPLVRAIDRIFAATRPGHVALDDARAPDPSTLADEKEMRTNKPKKPDEVVPTIKAPKNDGFAIGLADMRKFKKELREKPPETADGIDFDPAATPEGDKIPLVNYPGEIGPTGDRWYDIHKMVTAGHGREKILQHLRDKFALSPANANATLNRYRKNAEKTRTTPRKGNIKFSRGWYPSIRKDMGGAYFNLLKEHKEAAKKSRKKLKPDPWETFHKDVFWSALTDKLLEHGDPRAEIFRQNHTVAGSHKEIERQLGPGATEDWHHWFAMPDSIRLHIHQHRSADGTRVLHRVGLGGEDEGSNYAVFSPEQTRQFIDDLPEASQRQRVSEATKLSRKVSADQITKNADAQIGGSRFAYHLAQIANEFEKVDPVLARMAKHALTLSHRFKVDPRTPLDRTDYDKHRGIYDRIGQRLKAHVAGAADAEHKAAAKALRAESPATGSDYDLAVRATPAQKLAVAAAVQKSRTTANGSVDPKEIMAEHRVRAAARHFADAYNWDRVEDGLSLDRHVANFLEKNLTGHTDTDDLHEKAARSFDLYRGAAKNRAPEWHQKFWDKLKTHVREQTGKNYGADRLNESLARLSDRAVERREVGSDGWQNGHGWLGASKHMKFRREEVSYAAR